MSKAERARLTIAICTLVVAIGTWLFPASTTSLTYIYQAESAAQGLSATKTNSASKSTYQELKKNEPAKAPRVNAQLITEMSLHLFISQLKRNTLDSGKISYISENKHLLKENISFYELNNIISLITLDSNKIDAARLLVEQVNQPREEDVEAYSELFVLDSNRRTALALLYER